MYSVLNKLLRKEFRKTQVIKNTLYAKKSRL